MGTVSHGFGRFRDLTDVPSSYTGQAGKVVAVNATATGLEFITGGGGGSAITVQDEGSTLTTNLNSLNFVGSNITATAVGDAVTITVTAGASAGDLFLLMGG